MADSANLVELAFLEALQIELIIELGRTQLTVRELAALEKDDVIELNSLVNESLIVRTGDQVVAEGIVFLEGDRVCLRINRVLSQARPIASIA